MSKQRKRKPAKTWERIDGRKHDELRPIHIESGVLPNADGSAYIEMGRNKIIAGVYGPREMHPKRLSKPNMGVLRCRYHMAPFSVDPRRSPAPSRRDTEISMVMRDCLEPALFLERYPRSVIDVFVEIIQADGGTRCASINAAAVALADAGIPMKDLVSACAAGKYEGRLILDLGDYEDKKGESDMPVAYMPKFEQVTLLQMEGIMTREETEECVRLAVDGCKKIYEIQKEALKKKYAAVREEAGQVAAEAEFEPEPEPEPEEAEEPTTEDEPTEDEEQ
ncbi:exosome complex exonuclease Rrp41 [Candidatus Bathyarchaeota archaeon RBG_13_60_20]|jgi:exosome complex component RRP41|nr:MAG: exosome complex exonuclease Rrp41 [Candidatus Bathyarchaeota archaeon RBG_13_60_20]